MKHRLSRRTLAAALVMLMMLAVAIPAMAASQVIATATINIRSEARLGSTVVGTMYKDQVATKLGTSGNWTKVDYNGTVGYVNTPYVKAYGGSSDDGVVIIDGNTAYATAAVNVRSGPGTSYAKLGELRKGDAVTLVGATGNWSIIKWGTGTAYVSTGYLSNSGSTGGGSSTTGTTMAATTTVNVRSGPGTKYSILGYLVKGETVQKTGTSGNWTKVVYKNQTAYVSSTYLSTYTGGSTGGGSSSSSVLYALRATAVRSGPSTAYRAIGYLDTGDSITYLGSYSGSWYQVQLGVNVGYVYAPDMYAYGTGSGSSASGTVYATATTPVYSSTSTGSTLLGYLYQGESASRTGIVGTWTKINFEGRAGYVMTSRVTVTSGGSNTAGFTALNSWMYAISSYTYCYSIPSELSAYRTGYLERNERVWAVATNGTWMQLVINGATMYVPANRLGYVSESGSGGYIGATMYVQKYAGATTYSDANGTTVSSYSYRPYGATANETVSRIDRAVAVTINYQIGNFVNVTWIGRDNGPHTAFVEADRIASNYPN